MLQNINILDIYQNPLLSLKSFPFYNTNIKKILTDNYHVCCIMPSTVDCNAHKPWYVSCLNLLPTDVMRISLMAVTFSIFLFNILSISLQVYEKDSKYFKLIIILVNVSDFICCLYLIILLSADIIYHDRFITKDFLWRSSNFCCIIYCFIMYVLSAISCFYVIDGFMSGDCY